MTQKELKERLEKEYNHGFLSGITVGILIGFLCFLITLSV